MNQIGVAGYCQFRDPVSDLSRYDLSRARNCKDHTHFFYPQFTLSISFIQVIYVVTIKGRRNSAFFFFSVLIDCLNVCDRCCKLMAAVTPKR